MQNQWYVFGGNGCCFCALGADTKVWRSAGGPLGPYMHVGYLNAPLPNPPNTTYTPYTIPAQQFGVHKVAVVDASAPNGWSLAPLYIGLRWGSALDGRKDHDFQYWAAIQEAPGGETGLSPLAWQDDFELDLWLPTITQTKL